MAQTEWRRYAIPFLGNRLVYSYDGEEFRTRSTPPAETIYQWADYGAANRWRTGLAQRIQAAREAATWTVESMRSRVDPRIPRNSGGTYLSNEVLYRQLQVQQAGVLNAAFWALAQFYNALNVPWHMDPKQRILYRQLLAGPPESIGGQRSAALYGEEANYNLNWYKANVENPRTCNFLTPSGCRTPGFTGDIPKGNQIWATTVARPTWLLVAGAVNFGMQFGITMVPGGSSATRLERDLRYDYAKTAVNSNGLGDWPNERPQLDVSPHFSMTGPFFDTAPNVAAPHLQNTIYAPGFQYIGWLEQALLKILERTYEEIIFDVRAYTNYSNSNQIRELGGADQFFSRVLRGDIDRNIEATSGPGSSALAATASLAPALGATIGLAGGPLGAAIGGLIGGAIGLVSTLINVGYRDPVSGGRDDLGRFKPIMDRAWLSGNPTSPLEFDAPDFMVPLDDEPFIGSGRYEPVPVGRDDPRVLEGPGVIAPDPATIRTVDLDVSGLDLTEALLARNRRRLAAERTTQGALAGSERSLTDSLAFRLVVAAGVGYGVYRLVNK